MTEWQPISTAPKDAPRLLGINKFGDVYHFNWAHDCDGEDIGWWSLDDDDECVPLYWMPALPPLPQP